MSEQLSPDAEPRRRAVVEDLHVRNYDATEHVVWVRVVDDGDCAFERSFRLAPDARAAEVDALEPGEYEVEVALDGLRRWVGEVAVSGATSGLLVEAGNGTVSITEGPVR